MSQFWGSWPRKYQDGELEEALKRAFLKPDTDYIFLDDRRERFLIESACLGVEKGWLTEEFVDIEEQYSQCRYRLTDKGRRHFGLPTLTREEAARWLFTAGCVLGEQERYWFGSLYDLGRDLHDALLKHGPAEVLRMAKVHAKESQGPKCRALCLFARAVAREVA